MVMALDYGAGGCEIQSLLRRDGEKTDTMSKRTLKTNIIKMCVIVKLVVSMNKHSNVY